MDEKVTLSLTEEEAERLTRILLENRSQVLCRSMYLRLMDALARHRLEPWVEHEEPEKHGPWVVIYRQGGTERCRWILIGTHYDRYSEVAKMQKELEQKGYRAIITTLKNHQIIGMPIGWDTTTSPEDWVHEGDGWYVLRKNGDRSGD